MSFSSEPLHPNRWSFLRVLRTISIDWTGYFRFTFGCVSQIIPMGWPVHLAFWDRKPRFPASHYTGSSNSIILLPSRLPALVRNCTNTSSTRTPLLCSYRESCISVFLPIVISTTLCNKLYKVSGFHLLSQGDSCGMN